MANQALQDALAISMAAREAAVDENIITALDDTIQTIQAKLEE